jgi:hypothetical protein
MLEQHRQVGVLLADIEPVRLRWMKTADARDRDDLAGRYGDLSAVLNVHLRREVTEVMPAVDKVMTQKELTTAAEHGTGQFSKKFLVGYLGMVLATNPPGEREELFKEMPAPVRMATPQPEAGPHPRFGPNGTSRTGSTSTAKSPCGRRSSTPNRLMALRTVVSEGPPKCHVKRESVLGKPTLSERASGGWGVGREGVGRDGWISGG